MIKKLTLSTISACILAMGISAGAATVTFTGVTDLENTKVVVSGTVDRGENAVSVYIKRVGADLTVGSNNAPTDVMIMPTTVTTAEDGTKTFATEEFVFNASGVTTGEIPGVEYYVYASNQSSPYPFRFVQKSEVLAFVNRLADRQISVSNIFADLQNYAASFGADIAFANTQAKQDYLAQNMWHYSSKIAQHPSDSIARVDEVKKLVDLTKAELEFMEALATTVVQTGVDRYVGLYATSANIDITSYSLLGVDAKNVVCGKFVGKTYTNMVTFRNEWLVAVRNVKPGVIQPGGVVDTPTVNADKSPSGAVPSSPSGGVNTSGSALLGKYKDVAQAEWAVEAMEYVVKNGIMQGTSQNSFEPNTKVTREQVAKIISIAFNSYNQNATSQFKDVPNGHWSASYVGSAFASGLLTGKSDTEFGLGEEMTREDLCTVMYRAAIKMGYNFVNENSNFTDFENVNSYAQQAVKSLAGAKIISGMGDGMLAPKGTATRAQTAQMLMKLAELIK